MSDAVAAAESDNPLKIAGSAYRAAVDLAICEIERAALRVAQALTGRRLDLALAGVKEFHDMVRSLRTDMSLSGDGPWQRRLSHLRAGRIVETGPAGAVYDHPRHDYTKRLLAAVPVLPVATA